MPANRRVVPAGEPKQYSATVVRTVEDETGTTTSITTVARWGDWLREEWQESGETLVAILRPDLGKRFLLLVNRRVYIESDIDPAASALRRQAGAVSQRADDPAEWDRLLTADPAPVKVETVELPDEIIENYRCAVLEQRASYADGHTEFTKVFRALQLEGLAVRTESESGGVRVVTQRRGIKTDVNLNLFSVPEDFTRVESARR
jgi:hypothetical protein